MIKIIRRVVIKVSTHALRFADIKFGSFQFNIITPRVPLHSYYCTRGKTNLMGEDQLRLIKWTVYLTTPTVYTRFLVVRSESTLLFLNITK